MKEKNSGSMLKSFYSAFLPLQAFSKCVRAYACPYTYMCVHTRMWTSMYTHRYCHLKCRKHSSSTEAQTRWVVTEGWFLLHVPRWNSRWGCNHGFKRKENPSVLGTLHEAHSYHRDQSTFEYCIKGNAGQEQKDSWTGWWFMLVEEELLN